MRLFGIIDDTVNRFDRPMWMTPPFDGQFATVHLLEAILTGDGTFVAPLTVAKYLSTQLTASTNLTGDLTHGVRLGATLTCSSTYSGAIIIQHALSGIIISTSVIVGDLYVRGVLPGPYVIDAFVLFKPGAVVTDVYTQ